MSSTRPVIRGRGAADNPPNRFEALAHAPDPEAIDPDGPGPDTEFLKDPSRSLITYNDSPDVGFTASINPYRGCEHGCIYCYARPTHEYLGFSAGLDFETKILVKEDAPELLRRELSSPRWTPQVLAISGVTDPYQPVERRLELTRRCLEVLAEFRNPVAIITKNHLVTRDVDLLGELARHEAVAVYLSVTTLDPRLARTMEPRTSQPARRLAAIEALSRAGVPSGVLVAPVIPGLTDHEMPKIVAAAARAGAARRKAAVERSGPRPPIPALRQARANRSLICSAKIPSPFIREPNRGSFSRPPRIARMRFSTLSFRAGRCSASHASKSGATACGRRSSV